MCLFQRNQGTKHSCDVIKAFFLRESQIFIIRHKIHLRILFNRNNDWNLEAFIMLEYFITFTNLVEKVDEYSKAMIIRSKKEAHFMKLLLILNLSCMKMLSIIPARKFINFENFIDPKLFSIKCTQHWIKLIKIEMSLPAS